MIADDELSVSCLFDAKYLDRRGTNMAKNFPEKWEAAIKAAEHYLRELGRTKT